jgi:Arc/MetJ-type ribon-helix-helix transcriptional regulator
VPNQPATPNRTVRLDDELWDAVRRRADDDAVTMSEVVRRALRAYLRD